MPPRGASMSGGGSQSLTPGRVFTTTSGRRGAVGQFLGAGGQGEVYTVTLDGLTFALKWYHAHYTSLDTTLRARLERSVQRGAPTENFLWPMDLVDIAGSGSFGYVMPLRGGEYVSIRDLIAPPPKRVELTLPQRATICLHLANSFLQLHANGFCYQDINFGNIFLDPRTARVLICDNDNVNIDGAEASIYGTRKFMAPEVVRRETLPNSRTDLFSMSVLFFYTLFAWHPLDGRREAEIQVLDADAETRLYGTEPLFLFDPNDGSNGPVEGVHDILEARWESLPSALRDLFERAFGEGLRDPASRVLETEWRGPLRTVVDASFTCAECGFEHVADPRTEPLTPDLCLACLQPLSAPPMLVVGERVASLTVGTELCGDMLRRGGSAKVVARVETHPKHPDRVGLRNLSEQIWQVGLADQSTHAVPPGQVVRILPGSTLKFGAATGRIVGGETLMTETAA